MDKSFIALKQFLDSQPDFAELVLTEVVSGDEIEIQGYFPDRPKSFTYSWKVGQLDHWNDEWKQAVAKYIRTFILES